jgi:hypothetical protein
MHAAAELTAVVPGSGSEGAADLHSICKGRQLVVIQKPRKHLQMPDCTGSWSYSSNCQALQTGACYPCAGYTTHQPAANT